MDKYISYKYISWTSDKIQVKSKLRATRIKALNYQRNNSGVVFQLSYDKIGNSCKSAVAVGKSKLIYRYWKTTHEIQKNTRTSIYPGLQIKYKSRATRTKAFNYQRKNSGVAFQLAYDKIGNSCKSAVAVRNFKLIYRYWKTTHEIQKHNGQVHILDLR